MFCLVDYDLQSAIFWTGSLDLSRTACSFILHTINIRPALSYEPSYNGERASLYVKRHVMDKKTIL